MFKAVDLAAYDFWKTLEPFLSSCRIKSMPKKLRDYFFDLDVQIVTHLSWSKNSPVIKAVKMLLKPKDSDTGNDYEPLVNHIQKDENEDKMSQSYKTFFNRVLRNAAASI